MDPFEPYSIRQRRARRAGQAAVYRYAPIPAQMRAQAFHALVMAGGGEYIRGSGNKYWEKVEMAIVREHGYYHRLPGSDYRLSSDHYEIVAEYIATVEDTERFLDAVEIGMREAQLPRVRDLDRPYAKDDIARLNEATAELNLRFNQHDLGYSFVGFPGTIVRIDTQFVHAEAVEPAIAQLSALGWEGPLNEFLTAHRHYRRGEYKSAMNEGLKSFESTMKAVLATRHWKYEENWQAKNLIKALFDNGLLPSSLESYFGGIKSVLESGVPTLRNKQSGHGQGTNVKDVPDFMAAFTLNLTASNIVFLLSAHAALPADT